MKIVRHFLLIFSVFFISNFYSQKRAVDSLEVLLKSAKPACSLPCIGDTVQINIYLALCDVCDAKDKLKYARSAISLTDNILNQIRETEQRKILLSLKASAYRFCAMYYFETNNNFEKTIECGEKMIEFHKQSGNKINVKKGLIDLSVVYGMQGNYPKQLAYKQQALSISEELNDTLSVIDGNLSIGDIYFSHKDTTLALSYFEKSLKLLRGMPDNRNMPMLLIRVGSIYELKKDKLKANSMINEGLSLIIKEKDTLKLAINYFFVGKEFMDARFFDRALENLEISVKLGRGRDTASFGTIYNLMGKAYSLKNDHKMALEYFNKGLKIADLQENESLSAQSLIGIANCYLRLNKFKEASVCANRALKIRLKENLPLGIMYAEKAVYRSDSALGNYKAALLHFNNYLALKDKLSGDDIRKEATKQKYKDDFDKEKEEARLEQNKKDIIQAEEKKNQRIILVSVAGGLILILTFAIFVLRNLRITRKQKHIIEEQKHLVEEKHKEITDSINYAERIQRSFLASENMLDQNLSSPRGGAEGGGGYFVFFQPKDVVSGDFYWAAELSSPRGDAEGGGGFCLVTADSTGHGVPGAIMSILNISSLEKAIEKGLTEPAEILNDTRKTIIERLKKDGSNEGGKDGMDCSLISFDLKNNRLTYSAANNPIWIVRVKSATELVEVASTSSPTNSATVKLMEFAPDKMPVGKHDRDSVPFIQHRVDLQKGDMVYAITDGMPDQFGGPKGKKFMYKKLKDLLTGISTLPMSEQKVALQSSFDEWKGKSEQVDDVTIIGVRI